MNDQDKSREELIAEVVELRQRVAEERVTPELKTAAALFQVAPRGIHACDAEGRITFVNPSQEAITGYTADELVGTYVWDRIVPGPEKDALPAYFKRLVAEQPALSPFFAKNIKKGGEVFDIRVDWNYIRNPQAEVTGFVSIVSDITERRRAEDAVTQSEQRMRLHVDQTPLAVVEWDLELQVTRWNPGAKRVFGYTEEEALGRHFAFLVPPEVREHVDRLWADLRAKKGGERSTNENVTKDGRTILCEWYNTPLVNVEGQVVGFASLAEDITDRKQMEAALRESERRLSTLISNLPGVAYWCKADPDWTVEFLSEGYSSLTGYPVADSLGEPSSRYFDLIHPSDRQMAWEQIEKALAQKRHYQVEYRLRTAAGQEKWAWEQGTGVFSESGELKAIEGFTTEITDRKRAEDELQKANDRLERRVLERTAELTKANKALEREVQQRRRAEEELTLFRRFVEAATQGFGMADIDGQITYVNPFLARLFGAHSPDDVIGKPVSTFYPADYLPRREREIIPALRRREHWQGEQLLAFPDGQMHPTIHTIFPVHDDNGELLCTAAVIADITKQKQAEEAGRGNR